MYAAARMASAHNSRGAPEASSIVQALSNNVRFRRSAMPFDWGEYPAVGLCLIPWDLMYSIISPMYSVPRSVRNSLILHPLWRSAQAWYSLKALRTVGALLLGRT